MRRFIEIALLGLLAATPATATPIVDGPAVLQQSPASIQASLGRPICSKAVAPGDFSLPEGGTARVYGESGTRIDVDFENERSVTVTIVFPDGPAAPKTFEAALEAVNLSSRPVADVIRRDHREWHDLNGYFVRVIAAYPALDHVETIILSVHPLP